MKNKTFLITLFVLLFVPFDTFSADYKVYSANGFECASLEPQVVCQGSFPEINGVFTMMGNQHVSIIYSDNNTMKVYSYASFDGCLHIFDPTNNKTRATNRLGKSMIFNSSSDKAKEHQFCNVK